MDANCLRRGIGQWGQRVEFGCRPACLAHQLDLLQQRELAVPGATPPRMSLHHQPSDEGLQHPAADQQQGATGGRCRRSDCGLSQYGSAEPAVGAAYREEDEYKYEVQSDEEEELEPPLPLMSDDELRHFSPFLPPHHHMHNYDLHPTEDARYYHCAGQSQYSLNPCQLHPCHLSAVCQHGRPWVDSPAWLLPHGDFTKGSAACAGVSVNVPQFSVPPAEVVSQAGVMPASAEAPASRPRGRRRTVSLPSERRNVFITYSADTAAEMAPLVELLSKQGFQPAIDLFDNPIRCVDVSGWEDSFLKDPSTLIIIAISPKYKADVEGSVVDSHGLRIKYIHSMMQQEYIQRGSLNFRFIPVLFHNASQKHVPGWLQNTRVYRWPQDTQDLLLRLLREEKFVPPPVPMELALIIRPVLPSAAYAP